MHMTRFLMSAALVAGLTGTAFAKMTSPTLQDRQQAACFGDVQRLCGNAMPDVAKVTECMKPKKELVSAKCRALWDVK